jgi:uncharacterized protein (TIGR03067 family)
METVVLFVFLATDARPEAIEEFKVLSGTWDVIKVERDGKVADRELFGTAVRFTDRKPADLETRCDIYRIAIDPKATPRRITATVAGGEIKGMKMLVIYQRNGDSLTLQTVFGAKEFPRDFKSVRGDGTVLYQLRRVKK